MINRNITFIIMMMALISCTSVPKEHEQYYLLTAEPLPSSQQIQLDSNADFTIGIMPIDLAEHIDDKRVVTYLPKQRIQYISHLQWAEALSNNIQQVISGYIDQTFAQYDDVSVQQFPWLVVNKPDYIVSIELTHLGYEELSQLALAKGVWTLRKEGELINSIDFNYNQQVTNELDYVMEFSDLLKRLSIDISTYIINN